MFFPSVTLPRCSPSSYPTFFPLRKQNKKQKNCPRPTEVKIKANRQKTNKTKSDKQNEIKKSTKISEFIFYWPTTGYEACSGMWLIYPSQTPLGGK